MESSMLGIGVDLDHSKFRYRWIIEGRENDWLFDEEGYRTDWDVVPEQPATRAGVDMDGEPLFSRLLRRPLNERETKA